MCNVFVHRGKGLTWWLRLGWNHCQPFWRGREGTRDLWTPLKLLPADCCLSKANTVTTRRLHTSYFNSSIILFLFSCWFLSSYNFFKVFPFLFPPPPLWSITVSHMTSGQRKEHNLRCSQSGCSPAKLLRLQRKEAWQLWWCVIPVIPF